MNNLKSAYIHIPFCNSICSYCDFCKIYYNSNIVDNYLEILEEEIKEKYNGEVLETIYIGGGTPSSLSIKQLVKLFRIIDIFNKGHDCEITFECNIESIDKEKLCFLYNNGINRLSIGVQSFNKEIIKFLNRNHNKMDAIDKIKLAKDIGFNNINVDLMYAIPIEDINILKNDIDIILSLDIPHVSTYSLIIEPHTILYNKKIDYIDQDLDYDMYKMICNMLIKNGYEHYEISNFAKKGFSSKHNLVYWNNEKYYGFGLGASGYVNNVRYTNTKNISKYLKKDFLYTKEIIDFNTSVENEFILGFRKIKGINLLSFERKYNFSMINIPIVKKLVSDKKLVIKDGYIAISDKYLYKENDILINFLDIDYRIVKDNI